jgi:hypothetical protein
MQAPALFVLVAEIGEQDMRQEPQTFVFVTLTPHPRTNPMNESKTPFEELLLQVSNTSHECGAHDGTLDEYSVLHSMASAAKDALREHVRQLELSRNELKQQIAYANSVLGGCAKHGKYDGDECIGCIRESRDAALAKLAAYEGRTNYLCECGGGVCEEGERNTSFSLECVRSRLSQSVRRETVGTATTRRAPEGE